LVRRSIWAFLLVLLVHAWPGAARAEGVALRASLCEATAPAGAAASDAALAGLRFTCRDGSASGYNDRWVWLRVDRIAALRAMPAGWQLLIDQARFDQIAIVARAKDGSSQRIVRAAAELKQNWTPGGALRFTVDRPGSDLTALYVGFARLDALNLMRKVTAVTPADAQRFSDGWLVLMGLFAGALLSAFSYNLLIYTGQRYAFQRWYLVWAGIALAYGLTWTNMAAFALPGFVGPAAVRMEFILVGIMIGAGNMFFLSVLEDGMLPRWLQRAGRGVAVASVLLGVVASADTLLPAAMTDRWLNDAVIANALCVLVGLCYAIPRRSRIIWFYLVGWTPAICVLALRLARNLDLLPQDDVVDMATFASIAFESVVLSLAIADRFRLLRRERDLAEQARNAIAIESDTLRKAAHTDFLTGLGNRAAFQMAMTAMIEGKAGFSLFLIDVDHLKEINDRLGHDGGDAMLAYVSGRLVKAAGEGGHIARIGGDEFALLLPATSEAARTMSALDAIQGEQWRHAGRSWSISLSIGSARFPEDADSLDTLYKSADLALYQAKQLGRRRQHRYDPSLRALVDRKAGFVRDAFAGLDRDEFVLHFQPIVDLETGQCTGNEALLRWQHPEHGMLTPTIFGDILTERKIGALLQERVLAMALTELRGQAFDAPFLSVNFTAVQLRGPHAARRLLDQLGRFNVDPRSLCIELTEGIVLERAADDMVPALHLLREAGVRMALDDFGTGYASLIHLKQMPIDSLKIDRSFVLGMLEDGGQSEEIVRAIIGLGNGLRKAVIAEGIETEAQRTRLRELGCKLGQGYLFARPGPLRMGAETGPSRALPLRLVRH
jgi:diguanylate cyclase (GGDEF)-like protein